MSLVVVTGLGRCGSSLMMQMLHRAGVLCIGDAPAFEDERSWPWRLTGEWLAAQHGALKLLDPQLHRPELLQLDHISFIFLTRRSHEQALSSAKLLTTWGGVPPFNRAQLRKLESQIRRDAVRAWTALSRVHRPLLQLTFEHLVTDPLGAATTVSAFLRPDFSVDPDVMAGAVLDRGAGGAACLPYMLEHKLMGTGG